MATIGFIGSGNIGSTLARLSIAAGHDVVMSNSRGPQTLVDLVADLGPNARAGTPPEAAVADLVVVTIPLKNIGSVPAAALAGKVVIDTGNYYPQRDGRIPELDDESTTTSELLQDHLPESRVVKAFNNIHFRHIAELARPEGSPDRSVIAIAGDDDHAKQMVSRFLSDLGFDTYDVGELAEGWRFQRDTAAYAVLYDSADGAAWPPGPGRPVGATALANALSHAVRYRDQRS